MILMKSVFAIMATCVLVMGCNPPANTVTADNAGVTNEATGTTATTTTTTGTNTVNVGTTGTTTPCRTTLWCSSAAMRLRSVTWCS